MYAVYILKSEKDKRTYVGFTSDISKRLKEHNGGKVTATKNRVPFSLVYKETVSTLQEAKLRERYWKSGAGRRKLTVYFKDGFPLRS